MFKNCFSRAGFMPAFRIFALLFLCAFLTTSVVNYAQQSKGSSTHYPSQLSSVGITTAVIQPGNKTLKFTNLINQPIVEVRVKNQAVPNNGEYVVRITAKSPTQATVIGNSPTNITANGIAWNELTGLAGVEIVFTQEALLAIGDEARVRVEPVPTGKDNSISLRLPLYPNQEPYRVYTLGSVWCSKNEDRTHTRGLFQFDISAVPSTATVLSAELFLYCSWQWYRENNPMGAGMVLYRILKSWETGTNEGTNSPTINGVTGYERWFGDNQLTGSAEDWAAIGLAPGTDFEATPQSSTVLFTELGPTGYWNAPNKFLRFEVAQLVQGWLNGTYQNYGALLKGNQIADDAVQWDVYIGGYAQYWTNSEYTGDTTQRPKLVMKYESNLPPIADASLDQTLCAGASTTIGGDPTGSGGMGGPYTFSWSPTTGLDDPTSANPNAAPTATTTYTVTVTETATGLSDTDEMTLTVNPTPTANAGADKIIAPGQTVAIGGDPTASEGTPPYSYSWSPTTGLDDPTAANPNATLTSTMTYSVEVTDAKGCKAADEVTITVHSYVLLANQHIEINRNKLSSSMGALHSNNTLYCKRGDPTTFTGNLSAVGNVTIDKENTIVGDVMAGGMIKRDPNSTITGAAREYGVVAAIPIWAETFTAGGVSYTVPKHGALTLAPGSYGNVIVSEAAKLFLSGGKYCFTKIETHAEAELRCNVAAGVVQVCVTSSLKLGKEAQVFIAPMGEAGSEYVCFITQQSAQVLLEKESYVLGTLIAPNAEVFVGKNSSYRGAICAQRIIIERDVTFVHHDSPGALPLPKASANDEAVMSEQPVPTQFELLQNYPNPFNPTTEMRFALPEASHVVLKIFNTLGEEIRALVDAPFEAGYHRVLWDGKDNSGKPVASGVYLYQLRAGEFAQVRKMSLLR